MKELVNKNVIIEKSNGIHFQAQVLKIHGQMLKIQKFMTCDEKRHNLDISWINTLHIADIEIQE